MADPLRQFLPYGLEDLPALLHTPRAAPREALSAGLVAYLKRLGAPSASLEAKATLTMKLTCITARPAMRGKKRPITSRTPGESRPRVGV